jgi:hypothetical protein
MVEAWCIHWNMINAYRSLVENRNAVGALGLCQDWGKRRLHTDFLQRKHWEKATWKFEMGR